MSYFTWNAAMHTEDNIYMHICVCVYAHTHTHIYSQTHLELHHLSEYVVCEMSQCPLICALQGRYMIDR